MAIAMVPQDAPSPTKRATRGPAPPVLRDPSDPRGTLAVQTGFEDQIRQRAMAARAGVNFGHATGPSDPSSLNQRRRPLGFSRTEPTLSFAGIYNNAAPVASWQSGKDILDEVYAHAALTGKRSDELRPMWETGSATESHVSAASGQRQDSGFFAGPAAGRVASVGPQTDDGDGFDLDEAFGTAGSSRFGFLAGATTTNEDSQDSARTVTQRMKRAFEEGDAGVAGNATVEDDEEMAATDVEDEGEDDAAPGPISPFASMAAAGPRRVAGLKRGFAKTQSLPPSAFSMDF